MFSRNNVAATGKIVACELAPGYQPTSVLPCTHLVVLDVTPPDGEAFRAEAKPKWFPSDHPQVGEVVNVRCNPERQTAEVHLRDDRDPNFTSSGSRRAGLGVDAARRQALLDQPPGTPDLGRSSLLSDYAGAAAGGVQIINDSGADPATALEKLGKLREQGLISDEQLAQVRQQLGGSAPSSVASEPPQAATGAASAEERLQTLERLRADGILNPDEYAKQRQRILDSL